MCYQYEFSSQTWFEIDNLRYPTAKADTYQYNDMDFYIFGLETNA